MTERFAYDAVPYDTEANPDAHPRSMATLARLFGRAAAPPSTARVLEIGCGDGEHLIAAASYLPRARFVGFDLAADAIARGVAAARAAGVENVELLHRDVRDVRATGLAGEVEGAFDYVVAHGVYSWVPESIRADVLAVIRTALAPDGVGFLSVNALPGWSLRRALRILMREVSADLEDPAAKVRAALALVDELASAGEAAPGFIGVLAKAAEEYRAHVVEATPPEAPFSRYVFHDLLAECNDPFSVEELTIRLRAAGLRIVCETPLSRARAKDFPGLARDMTQTGSPFLQVLVCRDDGVQEGSVGPTLASIRTMQLWADLAPAPGGGFRTTTGALLHAKPGSPLARAAAAAPGFIAVGELAGDDDALSRLERDLFAASCEGVLALATEAAPIRGLSDAPCVDAYVRARAREALDRGARSAVLTSALHRSFRVPDAELRVIAELDGHATMTEVAGRVGDAALVDKVVDRFARYAFLLERGGAP